MYFLNALYSNHAMKDSAFIIQENVFLECLYSNHAMKDLTFIIQENAFIEYFNLTIQ